MLFKRLQLFLNTIEPLAQCCEIPLCIGLTSLLNFDLLFRQRRLLSEVLPIAVGCLRRLFGFSER